MHCVACNKLLTDFEATRRNAITKDYIDLCKVCFEDVKGLFPVIERKDLVTESDLDPCEQDLDVECSPEMDTGDLTVHYNTIKYSSDYYDVS